MRLPVQASPVIRSRFISSSLRPDAITAQSLGCDICDDIVSFIMSKIISSTCSGVIENLGEFCAATPEDPIGDAFCIWALVSLDELCKSVGAANLANSSTISQICSDLDC